MFKFLKKFTDNFKVRTLRILSIIVFTCALILTALSSISLPFLRELDIARTHLAGAVVKGSNLKGLSEIRFGMWGACYYSEGGHACSKAESSYTITISESHGNHVASVDGTSLLNVKLYTSTVSTSILFIVALFPTMHNHGIVFMCACLATPLSLVAIALDSHFLLGVRSKLNTLGAGTSVGKGFWLNLIAFFLLLIGLYATYAVWRREFNLELAGIKKDPEATNEDEKTGKLRGISNLVRS